MKNIEQVLDSREVAEMVEKNHKDLIRDIKRYIKQMNEAKVKQGTERNLAPSDFNGANIGLVEFNERNLAPVEFFKESEYTDTKGETRPCYLVTKKGCEFIAHKLTGTKGTVFTARYINRFHEMEDVISDKAAVQQAGNTELALIQETVKRQGKMLESINRKLSASMVLANGSMNGQDRYRGEIIRIIGTIHDEDALCKVYTFAKYVPQNS